MKKQKSQRSTFTKFKILDFGAFILASGLALMAVLITMPRSFNIFHLLAFMFLIVPTIVALVSGAPFVPTPMRSVKEMLKTAKIKKGQKVIDIGCGDGRFCHMANKDYGAEAVGFELSPIVYFIAKVCQPFWRSKAKIRYGDFRNHDLSDADHIVAYMLPETLEKFIPKFERELKKGAKVTSYAFHIGNWVPTYTRASDKANGISKIWVYEIGKHKAK
ncbi:SAM-dependent methyltransferase [Patescibacteria group bacterium]